ncbi:MAG TPA: DUF2203 domain-containing protein [Polyangiaceae bacterium]|nr:DUF2203 domain-containing protein [Polyangiaceae bacterium]
MSDEPREFTVDEANALVPTLHRIVSRQMLVLEELERELERLHKSTGVLPREFEPRPGDGPEVSEMKGKVRDLIGRFEEGWAEVQRTGAVVKDPRTGLVDFYCRLEGEPVWLCWRFGEEAIAYYHGLDEGLAGRKPLGAAGPARHKLLS